jgi:phenol/toluene 2-monooxygenase (NADH) P3/A3
MGYTHVKIKNKGGTTVMAKKKLTLAQKYHIYTRGLDWEPTYVSKKDIYPYAEYEGIKIKDWNKWEDPFRMTVDAYWKFQAEKG